MLRPSRLIIAFFVLLAASAGGWLLLSGCGGNWCFWLDWQKEKLITDFESCARYFPVMESYPERCAVGGKIFANNIGNELEKYDLIRLSTLRPNQNIVSPLEVAGQARGFWFFEASFPVRLTDEAGNELARGIAQAKGEWMTTEFVPFSLTLTFSAGASGRGWLILEKDNPSGLPENADELRVPVKFAPREAPTVR